MWLPPASRVSDASAWRVRSQIGIVLLPTNIDFVAPLVGYRQKKNGDLTSNPNISDASMKSSVDISRHILHALSGSAPRSVPFAENSGALFERALREWLMGQLSRFARERVWHYADTTIDAFDQYRHLLDLERLIEADETDLLATSLGRDYRIKPDVVIGQRGEDGRLHLHAAVSCKWTLRSDRAQNVRQEARTMIKERRGRLPHIVAVTMEPMPTRIASLARGTGDVDAVYHAAYSALREAIVDEHLGGEQQREVLDELIQQRRLLDIAMLPATLTL